MQTFKKFFQIAESSYTKVAYHVTKTSNLQNILKYGLTGGKSTGFTDTGKWADEYYGSRPLYVSLVQGKYNDQNTTEIKINVNDIKLLPDLPGLIDTGAILTNNDTLYWETDEEIPSTLRKYATDGEIAISDLLHNADVINAAIGETNTAAILASISPEKLSIPNFAQLNESKRVPKDPESGLSKAYVSGIKSKSVKLKRKAHFKRGAKLSSSDPKAYKPAPGDASAKTKTSKHVRKYIRMFGETLSESRNKALVKKSEKTGIPYSILKKVYDRGLAAWRTGHRPGATPQQWGYARVASFITGGKTRTTADADLWKKYKDSKK